MLENNKLPEHFELLHEMNRLFLGFLCECARRRFDCLGLPPPIVGELRGAEAARLDRAAALPRALFRMDLETACAADGPGTGNSAEEIALYCLQISLLQSARSLCRQSSHLAQTFLGLPASTLIRLKCLPLIELTNIAESAQLIVANYAEEPWIWHELLNGESTQDKRDLRMIALQPRGVDIAIAPARGVSGIR